MIETFSIIYILLKNIISNIIPLSLHIIVLHIDIIHQLYVLNFKSTFILYKVVNDELILEE